MIGEVCFTISFLSQTLYIGRMKPTLNRTTILKLIVDGIKLLAALEEKQNKPKKK